MLFWETSVWDCRPFKFSYKSFYDLNAKNEHSLLSRSFCLTLSHFFLVCQSRPFLPKSVEWLEVRTRGGDRNEGLSLVVLDVYFD